MKPTPGPWRIVKSPKVGWNIVDEHGNPAIARVYNNDADARLIAAAPGREIQLAELLVTAESLLRRVDRYADRDEGNEYFLQSERIALRAAIAKATQ